MGQEEEMNCTKVGVRYKEKEELFLEAREVQEWW